MNIRSRYIFLCVWVAYLILLLPLAYANDDICGQERGEALFICRTQQICASYRSEKPVYNRTAYEKIAGDEYPYVSETIVVPLLENAKNTYRDNIESIYQCAMIQSQRNILEDMMALLRRESSGLVIDTLGDVIHTRLQRIQLTSQQLACSLTDTDTVYNKLNILNETTFELCQYMTYLEWIREHHRTLISIVPPDNESQYSSVAFGDIVNEVDNQINEEIAHTSRVFPLVYQAYSQYENTFPMHFLLQVIYADYIVLRDKLYHTLMPIAQLGYKIINAMGY